MVVHSDHIGGRAHQGALLARRRSEEARAVWVRRLAVLALTILAAWLATPTALADDHGCHSGAQTSSGSGWGGPGPDHGDDEACPFPPVPAAVVPAQTRAPAASVPPASGVGPAAAPPAEVQAPDFRPQLAPIQPEPAQPAPVGEFPPVRPALLPHEAGPDWTAALAIAVGLALAALAGARLWARRRIGRDRDSRWPDG